MARLRELPWKRVLVIFFVALAARVLFSAVMVTHGDENFVSPGDSQAYIAIAQNLIEHGAYSNFESLAPNNHRPPLYPLFLLPFIGAGVSNFGIALIQGMLVALSAVIFYLMARQIFRENVVFIAALVFVLEPNGLLYSALMMSEPLFMVFFIPALFALALTIHTKNQTYLIIASACLAFSSLARVIALPLIVLVPAVAVYVWRLRLPWRALAASASVFVLIISPWLIFNVHTFNSLEFSSTSSINLYVDNAGGLERWLYPDKEIYTFNPEDRATTVAGAHEKGAIAAAFIREHLFEYSVFHTLYLPRLFIHDGLNDVYGRLTGTQGERPFSLYDRIATFNLAGLVRDMAEQPGVLASLVAKFGFLGITLLFFMHPFLLWRAGEYSLLKVSLFFVGFVLLYAFIISPVGMARFRFTIHPLLFLLAFDSLRLLSGWLPKRNKQAIEVV